MADPVTPPKLPERDTPFILMVVVSSGFFIMLLVMAYHEVPAANKDMLNTLLGVLGAGFTGLLGYYFGSSKSSQSKDDTIAKQLSE